MLTKLVELLSCTICFLGIIVLNYFQVVQPQFALNCCLQFSGNYNNGKFSNWHISFPMSATDALNQYYKGCISCSVLLSAGKESLLKSWFKCHDGVFFTAFAQSLANRGSSGHRWRLTPSLWVLEHPPATQRCGIIKGFTKCQR